MHMHDCNGAAALMGRLHMQFIMLVFASKDHA